MPISKTFQDFGKQFAQIVKRIEAADAKRADLVEAAKAVAKLAETLKKVK